jgi:hypothetical protein
MAGPYVAINGKMVAVTGTVWEIYLPTGVYEVGFCDVGSYTAQVKGFISGVLYDIVP